MKSMRKLSRRSFLGRVAGSAAAGAALLATGGAATAEELQVSDNDPSDPAGRGRTGYTDSDRGSNADRPGHGRRGRRSSRINTRACTDRDTGSRSDPVARGRGNGTTDRDRGNGADRPGCGRR